MFCPSPPPFTYVDGPKREALHLSIESSILGSLHNFNFFFWVMGQSNWLIAQKKKVGLVRHPKLINTKQNKCPRNKYPQVIIGVLAQASMGRRPKNALGFFFFHISLVPNVLPLCLVQVPNVFPNMFSIAPHFSPICTI
jgi:hypothetical protein